MFPGSQSSIVPPCKISLGGPPIVSRVEDHYKLTYMYFTLLEDAI